MYKRQLLLARRFYDYCTKVGTYSYVREYFALPGSIPDYYGAGLHGDCGVQALLFIVVSVLCLLAFRPLATKLRKAPTATNGDRNLGREATVLTTVTADLPGRVRLDGVDWNARCATPGDTLTPGQRCRVTELHSTLLIVEPVLTESRRA